MTLHNIQRYWLRSPGIYDLPRALSLCCLIVAFFSLFLNWATYGAFGGPVPLIYQMPPSAALAFLFLALSMRLARWERIDVRTARRVRFSRLLAGSAVLLVLLSPRDSVLLACSLSMLASVLIFQAHGRFLFVCRVFLITCLVTSTWLVLGNFYSVHGRIDQALTAEPSSALLLLGLTLSMSLTESRNGLIPLSLTTVLGERISAQLFLAGLLIPLMLGYMRLQFETLFGWPSNLLLVLHVMGTLAVMAVLVLFMMNKAREKLDAQRRTQADLEASESALLLLLEQGSEFFLTVSLAGRILTANENARRYLGLPDLRKSVVCIDDVILKDSHEKMHRLPESLLRGVSTNAVLLFRLADGETMPLYVTAASRIHHGELAEIVLVGRSLPLGLRENTFSQTLLVDQFHG